MRSLRAASVGLTVVALFTACASNHYVHKNGGAPQYTVRFVNNCSRFTGRLYIDDEYSNRRKIDVKARAVGSRPYEMQLAAGPHKYYVEFREFEETKFKQGSFMIRGPTSFEMC